MWNIYDDIVNTHSSSKPSSWCTTLLQNTLSLKLKNNKQPSEKPVTLLRLFPSWHSSQFGFAAIERFNRQKVCMQNTQHEHSSDLCWIFGLFVSDSCQNYVVTAFHKWNLTNGSIYSDMEFIGVNNTTRNTKQKTDKIWLCRMNRRLLLNFILKEGCTLFISEREYLVAVICAYDFETVKIIKIIIDKILLLHWLFYEKGLNCLPNINFHRFLLDERKISTFYRFSSKRRWRLLFVPQWIPVVKKWNLLNEIVLKMTSFLDTFGR